MAKVYLNSVDAVKDFCRITGTFSNVEVDASSGSYIVDAKSIMGLFSLDLSNACTITVHASTDAEAREYLDAIKAYMV